MSAPPKGSSTNDPIRPDHYQPGATYECIRVIEAWGLGFALGNAIKYICRAGKKGAELEDLKKAQWYVNRRIEQLEAAGLEVESEKLRRKHGEA